MTKRHLLGTTAEGRGTVSLYPPWHPSEMSRAPCLLTLPLWNPQSMVALCSTLHRQRTTLDLWVQLSPLFIYLGNIHSEISLSLPLFAFMLQEPSPEEWKTVLALSQQLSTHYKKWNIHRIIWVVEMTILLSFSFWTEDYPSDPRLVSFTLVRIWIQMLL